MNHQPIDPNAIPLLFKRKEFVAIVDGINAYLDTQPHTEKPHPNWYGWLALCYYLTSDFRNAIANYKVVLRLDPDAVPANTNLAHIRSCCPDPTFHNASEGIKHARHACHVSKLSLIHI